MHLTLSNLTLLTLSQPLPFINAPAWHGSILPRSSHTNSLVYQCIHAFNLQVYVSPILVGVESMYPAPLCSFLLFVSFSFHLFPISSGVSHLLTNYPELLYLSSTSNYYVSPSSRPPESRHSNEVGRVAVMEVGSVVGLQLKKAQESCI